jgi:hypothetical protein
VAGYVRQSVANIVNGLNITAPPLNAEFNALQTAFNATAGHTHDGTTGNAPKINLATSVSGYLPALNGGVGGRNNNTAVTDPTSASDGNAGYAPGSLWVNGLTGRVFVCLDNSSSAAVWAESVGVVNNAILPQITNTVDIGSTTFRYKDLYLAGLLTSASGAFGTVTIDTLTITTAATFTPLVVFNGGVTITGASTINSAVIGNTSPSTITGTTITATVEFDGNLTGDVTGNVTGNVTGDVTGNVTGDLTGNVTASSGTSTFNNVTINGSLDMNSGTAGTVTGLSAPVNNSDAATKQYVDSADALKLNLSGGTMSGAIAMGTNKITGLGTPTDNADASTKSYVDTAIANLVASAPGTLDTLNEIAAALGNDPNFATTITASIATKLSLSGGTMTGAINMGTNKVTSLGTPTDNGDATTKSYVDTADALKLNLSGGTMTGPIAMGTNKITGLDAPTANGDAATKLYVDTQRDTRLALAGGTMTGAIAMGTNKITGLGTPTDSGDATTKSYVDGILGSATAAATSAANALLSEQAAALSATNALASEQAAAASYDDFDDRYLGAKSSNPTVDNDGDPLQTGALYFNTVVPEMRVWTGSTWVQTTSSPDTVSERSFLATAGQTTYTFTGGYRVNFTYVWVNGVLLNDTDIVATDGQDITFNSALSLNDEVRIITFKAAGSVGISDIVGLQAAFDDKVDQTAPTGSAVVPAGTDAQRDSVPSAGFFRFNTTSNSFEGYDGSAWGAIGGGGGGIVYTRQTANYTASAGEGIIADTSVGAWTLTLPATPSVGDVVVIADGDDWGTTNLTVARNGSTIEGSSSDLTLDVGGVSVTFVYDGFTWHVYVQAGITGQPGITTGKAIAMAIVFG